jgi:nucleoside-diphosphate-sugar epimerase
LDKIPSIRAPLGIVAQEVHDVQILITGGAGYLGSTMVRTFLDEGYRVRVVDSFLFDQDSLLDCCRNDLFEIVRGDARDEALIGRQLRDVDVVIPLAAIVGAPACDRDPVTARTLNLDAISMLLRLRSRQQLIVFPCTNSGYGVGEQGIFCTEETPLRPVSLYGRLKVEAEKQILDAGNSVTLRLATVFGVSPRLRLDLLVNDFTYRAFHDHAVVLFQADFKRNYVHVRDVARAFLHAIRNAERMSGQPYNFGLSDANLNKRELCEIIREAVPDFHILESEVGSDPDKRNYIVSNAKIEATGMRATIPVQQGVKELLKSFAIIRPNRFANV